MKKPMSRIEFEMLPRKVRRHAKALARQAKRKDRRNEFKEFRRLEQETTVEEAEKIATILGNPDRNAGDGPDDIGGAGPAVRGPRT